MSEILNYEDVADMFKDKNSKIFSENIIRNISDNDSSLRLTISNKISLATSEILRKTNDSFRTSGTKYDFKSLSDLFTKYGTTLTECSFSLIDQRKGEVLAAFQTEPDSIDGIIYALDGFLPSRREEFERSINDVIYSKLEEELASSFQFSSEQQQQQVYSYLNRYDSKVTSAVESSIEERNASLKNSVLDTSKRVENLNSLTTDYSIKKNKAA